MNKVIVWPIVFVGLIAIIGIFFLLQNKMQPELKENQVTNSNLKSQKTGFPNKTQIQTSSPQEKKPLPTESQSSKELAIYLQAIDQLLLRDEEIGNMDAQKINEHMRQLRKLLEQADPSNIAAIVSTFEKAGITEQSSYDQMDELMKAWARFDGKNALEYALNQMPKNIGSYSALTALRNLEEIDKTSAIQFYHQMPRGLKKQYVDIMISKDWKKDPQQTITWVESIQDPKLKNSAVISLAKSWSETDGKEAAEWLISNIEAPQRKHAAVRIVENWVQQEPEAAIKWALELSDEQDRDRSLSQGILIWAEQDPFQAGEMLNKLPYGPKLDEAVYNYSISVADKEPETAIGWAESIQNSMKRNAAMTQIAITWFHKDKDAALTWLETSGLPEENRKAVVNSIPF